MRLLLLMLVIFVSSYAMGQNAQVQVQKIPNLYVKDLTKSQLDSLLNIYNVKIQNGKVQISPKLKPGIKYLADGMPCIIPEEPTAGKIPNAFKADMLNRNRPIPNPALPKKTIPPAK